MTVYYTKHEGGTWNKAVIRSSKKVTLMRIKKSKSIVIGKNRAASIIMPNCYVCCIGSELIIAKGNYYRNKYKAVCKLFKHKIK
jgi:hypothetical protein